MTDERVAIENLSRCRFLPASFDKRFARDMMATPEDHVLTVRQRQTLWKLAWKYRRQTAPLVVEAAEARRALPERQLAFEDQLDSDPSDAALRLVYADWLAENGLAALEAAQRWMVAGEFYPHMVPVGMSYGPTVTRGCNYEWTFGMKVWEQFGKGPREADSLAYHHRSRVRAEGGLAAALAGRREESKAL